MNANQVRIGVFDMESISGLYCYFAMYWHAQWTCLFLPWVIIDEVGGREGEVSGFCEGNYIEQFTMLYSKSFPFSKCQIYLVGQDDYSDVKIESMCGSKEMGVSLS